MKNNYFLFLILAAITTQQIKAQTYQLTYSTSTYTPLTGGARNLNNNLPWDELDTSIALGFTYSHFGTAYDTLQISGNTLFLGDSSIFTGTGGIFNPHSADLIDRAYDENLPGGGTNSLSPITYEVTGTAGNRIFKLQYENAGYYEEVINLGTSNDSTNYQVWFYEGSNEFEVRFGPTSLTNDSLVYGGEDGLGMSFVPSVNFTLETFLSPLTFVIGDSTNPRVAIVNNDTIVNSDTSLTMVGTPIDGGIFRFTPLASVTICESITITTTPTNVACNGEATGSATASATGGTMPYSYLWSNGATTASIMGVAAGRYTITVTDENGCTDTSSVSITEPDTIAITTSTDVACNGEANGSATASATGGTSPYTYAWSNSATTASITGVAAGTYTITVTDANGCTAIDSAVISEPVFDLGITIDTSLTEGTITAIADAAGITYRWFDCSNNTFTPISGETNQGFTIPASGSYAVELTQNGCVDTSDCLNLINVSIAENSLESNMRFYPNPTSGEFSIELGQEYKNLNVVVRNAIGQQVAASSYANTNFINLAIEGDAGLYFIELTANAGLQTVVKVVKQ